MKKFAIGLMLAICCSWMQAQELSEGYKAMQHEIVQFLTEEGYVPHVDSAGDIWYKNEGVKYYIEFDSRDEDPYFITFGTYYSYSETRTKERMASIMNGLNKKKTIRLKLYDKSYEYASELFLVDAEEFKYVFHQIQNALQETPKLAEELLSD